VEEAGPAVHLQARGTAQVQASWPSTVVCPFIWEAMTN
jgi:hypothetical protein